MKKLLLLVVLASCQTKNADQLEVERLTRMQDSAHKVVLQKVRELKIEQAR